MPQCMFKTRGGNPCGGIAMGSHGGCFAHDPDFELARRRNARKGGKRGGRGRTKPATVDLQRLQQRGCSSASRNSPKRCYMARWIEPEPP